MKPHKVTLTGELRNIADIIGFAKTLQLAHDFGGHEVKIPKIPRQGQKLVECIGLEATQKLTDYYGTGKLEIPLGLDGSYNSFIRRKGSIIRQGIRDGKNNVQIARETGYTTRTVRKHKNKKSVPDNPSLFD